jgi:EmrB/QacA subfamily drug resistance transporter
VSSIASQPQGTASAAPTAIDRRLIAVSSVVILGAVMSILDTTVINVAIPTLAHDFHTSLTTIQWVATGYTLALATVIPLSGWGADRFGTKRLYMTSVALFLAGSALSGMAWSAGSLIFFRILQGLGGGMIMPTGMTVITRAAGPQRIGRVMSIIGVPMLLGPILGPIIGGWLVDDVSWRWIFFINLPIGVAALLSSSRVLPRDEPAPGHRLDWRGLVLLSPALAAMIYGLAESNASGGFDSVRVLAPLLTGVALLGAFILHALHAHTPLIDLRLFANRVFSAASFAFILFAVAVFGTLLLLPLYFQTVRGESALVAGLLLAPQGLGAMLSMPVAGQLTDRIGVGRIAPVGVMVVLASVVGLTRIGAHTSYWLLGADLFAFGFGMGSAMMPIMSGALQTLREAAVARASTALNIIQQVGASVGTAVLSVLLVGALSGRLPAGAPAGIAGAGADPAAGAAAYGHTFLWALALIAVAFGSTLLLPRRKPELPGEEAERAAPLAEPGTATPSPAGEAYLSGG